MSRIRSKDTLPELRLRQKLFARGLRYQVDAKWLPGRPDIVFTKQKVAIFVDGDFWHGYDFEAWKNDLAPYWKRKIAGNRERDKQNVRTIQNMGWVVLRFWEHDIMNAVDKCANLVQRTVRE